MRLKEIKPGMVIHCKNHEEKKALLEEAERLGYVWYDSKARPTDYISSCGNTIYFYDAGKTPLSVKYKHIVHSCNTDDVTNEFSDLILPELTAEEVVEWLAKNYEDETYREVFGRDYLMSNLLEDMTPSEVVEKIAHWKSDHEKKEPEIETVDICRIIEIQPDGRKRCVHEEDMNNPNRTLGDKNYLYDVAEILKRYCMEHDGKFIAVHEVVSRVKAVE